MIKHLVYQSHASHLVHLIYLWGHKMKCKGLEDAPTTFQII